MLPIVTNLFTGRLCLAYVLQSLEDSYAVRRGSTTLCPMVCQARHYILVRICNTQTGGTPVNVDHMESTGHTSRPALMSELTARPLHKDVTCRTAQRSVSCKSLRPVRERRGWFTDLFWTCCGTSTDAANPGPTTDRLVYPVQTSAYPLRRTQHVHKYPRGSPMLSSPAFFQEE